MEQVERQRWESWMFATHSTGRLVYVRGSGTIALACQPAAPSLPRQVHHAEVAPAAVADAGGAIRHGLATAPPSC